MQLDILTLVGEKHVKLCFEDKEIDELSKVFFLLDETDKFNNWLIYSS